MVKPSAPPPSTPHLSDFVYILSVDVGWPDMSWQDAEAQCKTNGFYLARILSPRDQNLMQYKLAGFKQGVAGGFYQGAATPDCAAWPCGMWIGANDRGTEGDWQWTNGALLSHYGFGGFDNATGQEPGLYPWGSLASGATSDEPNDYGGGEEGHHNPNHQPDSGPSPRSLLR